MEALREEIEKFLVISSGDGSGAGYGAGDGYGDGSGSGAGYGAGDGYGAGYGHGDGDGYGDGAGDGYGAGAGDGYGAGSGSGYGSGSGDGIKSYNDKDVHLIDNVETLIESVRGNYAKGYILQSDLTLKPCYIARVNDSYAHGDTLREAFADAQEKAFENLSEEERITQFLDTHKDREKKYSAKDLFDWHGVLTGSCRLGREQFCKEHNIDLQRDSFTLSEFIELTKNNYGGGIIRQIKI